jgi:hypothetical protein
MFPLPTYLESDRIQIRCFLLRISVATWITSCTKCFWDSCRKDWWLVAWKVMP